MTFADSYRLAAERVAAGDVTPVMLFPLGNFTSQKYPELPLTRELADEVIANYSGGVLGTDVFVEASGKHDTSAPAAAWVTRVYTAPTKDGGEALFADVRWTESGARTVSDREYAYNSVELGPVVDNRTGAKTANVLRSITLTNTPVIRLLPPILEAADSIAASEPVELLCSEVTLSDQSTKSDTDDGTDAGQSVGDASGASLSASEGKPATEPEPGAEKGGADMKSVALKLNLAEDASEDVVLAEVVKLAEHDAAETARADAAEAKLAEEAKRVRSEAVERTLSELIEGGHLLPASKDEMLALAEDSPTGFDRTVAVLKTTKAIVLGELGNGSAATEAVAYADASVELAEKAKARAVKDAVSIAAAQSLVLSEDSDLAGRYRDFRMNPRKEA